MSPRALRIALAASVALNVFAAAGGLSAYVLTRQADARIAAQARPGRDEPFRDIVARLEPETRERVRASMRQTALAARPDFEQARADRRQALALARADAMDPAAVSALLERSRAAETRGRSRIEQDSVALLATLPVEDRRALSEMLNRRGRGGKGGDGGPRRGGPAPDPRP